MILVIIYAVLGYWSIGQTIYANKIVVGSMSAIILQKLILGIFFGWILIPISLIKKIFFR